MIPRVDVNHGSIAVSDGCRLAYSVEGPDATRVLVLSHSLGCDSRSFDRLVADLSTHMRVLRYDTRGHGGSESPVGATTMERLAMDVIELLDALGINHADFCGVSLGGMVGQHLAALSPSRINRLILANTSAHMPPASIWNSRIATVMEFGMKAVADDVIDRWFTPSFRQSGSDVVRSARTTLIGTDVEGYAACCAAIRDMDLRESNPAIEVDTLVITGSEDDATPPSDGADLALRISKARLVTLTAAHLSHLERPKAFSAAVRDFLGPP